MTPEELKQLEANLWQSTDTLRANSDLKSSEYSTPVMGLIFLKFADNKYRQYAAEIQQEYEALKGTRREKAIAEIAIEKCGFYLPDHAPFKGFPAQKKVNLFRVAVSTNRTDYIATNDLSQSSTDVVQEVCKIRWKIEEFHREIKQLTGIEYCQCRQARLQRNHIACAMLVWIRLKNLAAQTGQTIYQIKHNFLSNYLIQQRKRPSIPMCLL
ncbi:MAG: type I restriction-modification system subunit M N-terminal domain-containing protein [Nostoc sp.]|uniref:type I restriction-modification system subunit M N-terminal domain-containing protein n=1 Tax=Nostoc sp. TaxID=1180 RepID=UPI002FF957A1